MQILREIQYNIGFTDNKTNMIVIHLFMKKSEVFPHDEKFMTMLKVQTTLCKGLKMIIEIYFTL